MSPLTVNGDQRPTKKRPAVDDAAGEDDDDNNPAVAKVKKQASPPAARRIIIETKLMSNMMEDHIFCPTCKAAVVVSFPTVCVASGCRIDCSNPMCGYVRLENPEGANVPLAPEAGSPFIVRTTDYSSNILFVLSFLSSGDGGKEAERFLGLLGLHNSTSMEKRSFSIIESRLSPVIKELDDEILLENLHAAVKIYYDGAFQGGVPLHELWLEQVENPESNILAEEDYPDIGVSADMAWQKRSSGHRYDSNSGHATLVEWKTRKVVEVDIRSKICNVCKAHSRHEVLFPGTPVKEHNCQINHTGSSGSMEPISILEMVKSLHSKKFVNVTKIVTDDDSSIKAKLKWSNHDHMANTGATTAPKIINRNGREVYRPNHGELPAHLVEPTFLADPNHRKKTLKGELYRQLKKKKDDRCGLTKVDVLRITTNFAYMCRSLHEQPEILEEHGKAVVEHHFDNHEFCGAFCRRKLLSEEDKKKTAKIYRDKDGDAKLYKCLTDILRRFITLSALKEVGHGSDTQVNESLNNTISWLAPKNKTYSGSVSLRNRISMGIGISSVGTYEYFVRLLEKLGCPVTDHVRYYLSTQQKTRATRIAKYKKKQVKKNRNAKLYAKLKEYSEKIKIEKAKSNGCTYQPGIGMDGGYCEAEVAGTADDDDGTAGDAIIQPPQVCRDCGELGHKVKANKKCVLYVPRSRIPQEEDAPPVAAVLGINVASNDLVECTKDEGTSNEDRMVSITERDGDEQAMMDSIPFDEDDDAFFDALEDAADDADDFPRSAIL